MAVPSWLTVVSWTFLSIGLVSAVVIVADSYLLGHREHMKVMEAVWPLTALYAGPLVLAAYARWGRPISHRWMSGHGGMRAKPFWPGPRSVPRTAEGAACWAT